MAVCSDEVRIKYNLVYDKYGLQLIGYVDIGDINNELLKFERSCSDDSSETSGSPLPVAKHVIVHGQRSLHRPKISLRPICHTVSQPIRYFHLPGKLYRGLKQLILKLSLSCVTEHHKIESSFVCTRIPRKLCTRRTIRMQANLDRYISFQMLHIFLKQKLLGQLIRTLQ